MNKNKADSDGWYDNVNAKYTTKMIKPKTQEAADMIECRLRDRAMIVGGSFFDGVKHFLVEKDNKQVYRIPANRFFNLFDVEGIEGGVRSKSRKSRKRRKSHKSRR